MEWMRAVILLRTLSLLENALNGATAAVTRPSTHIRRNGPAQNGKTMQGVV